MKSVRFAVTMAVLAAGFGLATGQAFAADLYKTSNNDALGQLTSWSTISGSQTPNPGSFTATDNWYFNQLTMGYGSKGLWLGGDMTIGGIALDWAGAVDPGQGNYGGLVIEAGGRLTLTGGVLGNDGTGDHASAEYGILLARNTGGTLTVRSYVALDAHQSWLSGRSVGGFTVAGNVNLGGYNLIANIAAGTSTISGVISGTGSLTKIGNGTLTLSGSNCHSGGTTLGAGVAAPLNILEVKDANALGVGTLNFRGGVLHAGTAGMTLASAMNVGDGDLRVGGYYGFTLSGNLVVDNRSCSFVNDGDCTMTLGAAGSTLTLGGADSRIAFDTHGDFVVDGNITGTGNPSPDMGAVLVSVGNVTFNGTNDFTGQTNVTGGTISGSGSMTASRMSISGGSILLKGGSTTTSLDFGAGVSFACTPRITWVEPPIQGTTYDVFSYGGTVTGVADLKVDSVYRGVIADTGTKYTFTAGEHRATRTWNTVSGVWDVADTANFREGDRKFCREDHVVFGDIAEDAVISIAGGILPRSAETGDIFPSSVVVGNSANKYIFQSGSMVGSMALVKNGAGTLQILSKQHYWGGTTVNGGILELAGGGGDSGTIWASSIIVNDGAVLKLSTECAMGQGITVDCMPYIDLVGGTLMVNTTSRQIFDGATINMTGGRITGIEGSCIEFSKTTMLPYGHAFINVLESNTTSTIDGCAMSLLGRTCMKFGVADGLQDVDLDIASVLQDFPAGDSSDGIPTPLACNSLIWEIVGDPSMCVAKDGPGTMRIGSVSTYTCATEVNDGRLMVDGSIASSDVMVSGGAILSGSGTVKAAILDDGAGLAPGNRIGVLTVVEQLRMSEFSVATFEVGGATVRGVDYDAVVVGGTVTLDGTINVVPANGFDTTKLTAGTTLDLVDAASVDASCFNMDTDLVLAAVPLAAGLVWDKGMFLFDGTIRVVPVGLDYASWGAGMGLAGDDAQPMATPYKDGIPNLLRYAMNLPANSAKAHALAADSNLMVATGMQEFVMDYRRRKGMLEVTLVVQTSTNLLTWVDAAEGTMTKVSPDPDVDTELYRYRQTVDGSPRYFRLKATKVP